MERKGKARIQVEESLDRTRVVDSSVEVYPEPERSSPRRNFRKSFAKDSTFVIASHFLKALFGPMILALPCGFKYGGLMFCIFGFLAILSLVAYNIKRLIISAAHLSEREQKPVRTYDELAYVSFDTCTDRTKGYAVFIKTVVNAMFFITYIDACIIYMIFVATNISALFTFHYPETFLCVRHFLFFQVALIMAMSSIRDLKYIAPFSFVATILMLVVVSLTTFCFFIKDLPDPLTSNRIQIGSFEHIIRFACIVMFSLSGISIALTLKSSMKHPENFFSCRGVYNWSLAAVCGIFISFGYLGYLKFGPDTKPSIMLNLPYDNIFSICIKVTAIFAVFLNSPLVFYIAFNVLWNNYLKPKTNPINVHITEFFIRYCLIACAYLVATAFPDLGSMITLKGALFHSNLELTFPAILDYVTFYPEHGTGKAHGRLLKFIAITFCGVFICIGGTTVAIVELFI